MGRYAVDPDLLQHIDVQIEAAVAHARSGLLALTAELHALLDTGWRSRAATAFTTEWREWRDGACDLLDALESMGVAIGLSARGYAGTEAAVQASMVAP